MSTIIDVAKAAGVSKSTVSLVLTGSSKVHPDTKALVLKTMDKLQYRPRLSARQMAGKRTYNIGVLVLADPHSLDEPYRMQDRISLFVDEVTIGIEASIQDTGYNLAFARQAEIGDAGLQHIISDLHVDGVLMQTGRWNPQIEAFANSITVPLVVTGSNITNETISCVFVDKWKGSFEAVQHLLGRGYRRIAFINTDDSSINSTPKFNGYRNALEEQGIPLDPLLLEISNFSAAGGMEAMQRLLALPQPPDAVFCAFDGIAVGAAHAILASGLRIPEDVAVMGFEDSWLASHFFPPLSTVRIPKFVIGRTMVQEIVGIIEGSRPRGLKTLLDCSVVARAST